MSESTQEPKNETPTEQKTEQQPELIPTEPVYKGSEVQKFIDEANALKAKLKQIEQEKKQKELEELTKNNEWQKIADMNAAKAAEYEENYNKLKTALVNDKKMSAIKDAAIQSGLLKEALPLLAKLDFPEVTIENNGQGVSVVGIDRAIQRIKATNGFMFSKSVPNVNTASPSVNHNSSASITWDDLKKAEADAKKTGKYETYKELVLKYKAQS